MSEHIDNIPNDAGAMSLESERYLNLVKVLRNEALIEFEPTSNFLSPTNLQDETGGSLYYGTGLTTPRAISAGLPFDMLGMMLAAEKIRRAGNLDGVYHHIADTHAKTNEWIEPAEVDVVAESTIATLEKVKKNLDLTHFNFVLSSTFDTQPDYIRMLDDFEESDEHEYVVREMADMEWYRTKHDVRIKLGWIIQAKETEIGFDERRFDREYLRFRPGAMSFVYTKPGRTFDLSRPKASPYISIADEPRLLLAPGVNVREISAAQNDPSLGGAKKHLTSIVRLYESMYGSLGKAGKDSAGLIIEDKMQAIIDRCFAE